MAQREEETELKVPESVTLCANNCGRQANPATKNLCRSCFLNSPSCSTHDKPRSTPYRKIQRTENDLRAAVDETPCGSTTGVPSAAAVVSSPSRSINRCSGCRKKVGLAGFRCRCGDLFCAEHRYSDRHDCSFDYKAAGREAIERGNPVVKAAKIVRI